MILCDNCDHNNREGFFFCENCGFPLDMTNRGKTSTRRLNTSTKSLENYGLGRQAIPWGTARLSSESEIFLHIPDQDHHVRLIDSETILVGREDTASNHHPDIDLVPFGGVEKGVSRNHARINRDESTLTIVDIGSANGTYLNGQRLEKNEPRILRDGDEIRFGKLITRIFFK